MRSVSGSDWRRARSASAILAQASQRTSKRRSPRSSRARTSEGLRSLSKLNGLQLTDFVSRSTPRARSRATLRSFANRRWNGREWLVARPRRLERHAPVQLTVGTTVKLRRVAEVEIRMPRFADRPAAVALFKIEESLWSRGLLGFAALLGHVVLPLTRLRLTWEGSNFLASPVLGKSTFCAGCGRRCDTPTVIGAISSRELEL